MATPYHVKKRYIQELYDYEVEHNIPDNQRLTYNQQALYAPSSDEIVPDKKRNVDIRSIMSIVDTLKRKGEL